MTTQNSLDKIEIGGELKDKNFTELQKNIFDINWKLAKK